MRNFFIFVSYLVVAFLSGVAKANISGLLLYVPNTERNPMNHFRNLLSDDINATNDRYASQKAILGVILIEFRLRNLKTKTLY